jgi:hypothetical protein
VDLVSYARVALMPVQVQSEYWLVLVRMPMLAVTGELALEWTPLVFGRST